MDPKEECLTINVKSWHYRLNKFVWGKHWDMYRNDVKFWRDQTLWLEKLNTEESLAIHENRLPKRNEPYPVMKDYWIEKNLNLCPYVRRVFFSIIFLPFVLIGKALLLVPLPDKIIPSCPLPELSWDKKDRIQQAIMYPVGIGALFGVVILMIYVPESILPVIVISSTVAGVYGLAKLIGYIYNHSRDWRSQHPWPKIMPKRKPSTRFNGLRQTLALLKAYFEAKHKKVCPCLERVK